jgi:hypothetical protein
MGDPAGAHFSRSLAPARRCCGARQAAGDLGIRHAFVLDPTHFGRLVLFADTGLWDLAFWLTAKMNSR